MPFISTTFKAEWEDTQDRVCPFMGGDKSEVLGEQVHIGLLGVKNHYLIRFKLMGPLRIVLAGGVWSNWGWSILIT